MNLGDEADSPWSDERSNSPHQATANGQKPESEDSKPNDPAKPPPSVSSSSPVVKTPGGRSSQRIKRYAAQPTRLEAVDNTMDPLGPLGASAPSLDEPEPRPELPQKEPPAARSPRPDTATSQSSRQRGALGPSFTNFIGEDGRPTSRGRVEGQDPGTPYGAAQRQQQEGSGAEQAARPTFYITVGDPHKVGDLTSSHIVYQIRTKTNSKAFRQTEFEVSRRYKDFLWLYNQLHGNNPGTIVPPPPDKQAVGRFESDFVESRRSALEKMLNKTAAHYILQHDTDFKIFLESESFSNDVKHREKKDPDMPAESKGMFSSLNLSVGSGAKFVEHDDWFLDRRVYLDNLDTQLRGLLKAIESAVSQRKALSDASFDFSQSLNSLSQVELSPMLTGPLASLSDLHLRIRDLYARQAQQDGLTLTNVIDEYIRLIGSIKTAFNQRQKSWQQWHTAESDLAKRRSALDKLHRGGRTQQDRISTLQADVADAERRAHQARLTFEDLGKSMRGELERFEREKVEDFRGGVETWLEGGVEAQKELIELWETYLMHLDADDEDSSASGAAALSNPSDGSGGGGGGSKEAPLPQPPPDAAADSSSSHDIHAEDRPESTVESPGKPGTSGAVDAAPVAGLEAEA